MEHLLNDNLLKYFTQYALMEGSTSVLSIAGLKNLLQNQFAQYLKVSFTLIWYYYIHIYFYIMYYYINCASYEMDRKKEIQAMTLQGRLCAQMVSLTL